MNDPINHPPHYTAHPSGVECIQVAELMGYRLGNAFKYIWRHRLKGAPAQDIAKALFYIERHLESLKFWDRYNVFIRLYRYWLLLAVRVDLLYRGSAEDVLLEKLINAWKRNDTMLLVELVYRLHLTRAELLKAAPVKLQEVRKDGRGPTPVHPLQSD